MSALSNSDHCRPSCINVQSPDALGDRCDSAITELLNEFAPQSTFTDITVIGHGMMTNVGNWGEKHIS